MKRAMTMTAHLTAPSSVATHLSARVDNTMLHSGVLRGDPESETHYPNRISRPVNEGHWVKVLPTPLPAPRLIAYSPDMAAELGLDESMVHSEDFLRYVTGDTSAVPGTEAWATPYAVSVHGQGIGSPCQFQGRGYGDGRAAAIGEFRGESGGQSWELQLKGSGTSPFSHMSIYGNNH